MFKKVFVAALLTYTSALHINSQTAISTTSFSQLGDSDQEWADMIKLMDKNGNNKVSWWEVKRYIKSVEKKTGKKFSKDMKQKLKEHFDELDADNNG